MGLLPEQTTIEVLTSGQVSGYVFADAVRDGVQALEWVLFDNFAMAHDGPMTLRPVTDTAWQHGTLAAFSAHVHAELGPGRSWRFCHARATVQSNGHVREYELHPGRLPDDFQIEAGRQEPLVIQGSSGVLGWCYATSHADNPGIDVEHWELTSPASLALGDGVTVAVLDDALFIPVSRTVDVENRYDDVPPAA